MPSDSSSSSLSDASSASSDGDLSSQSSASSDGDNSSQSDASSQSPAQSESSASSDGDNSSQSSDGDNSSQSSDGDNSSQSDASSQSPDESESSASSDGDNSSQSSDGDNSSQSSDGDNSSQSSDGDNSSQSDASSQSPDESGSSASSDGDNSSQSSDGDNSSQSSASSDGDNSSQSEVSNQSSASSVSDMSSASGTSNASDESSASESSATTDDPSSSSSSHHDDHSSASSASSESYSETSESSSSYYKSSSSSSYSSSSESSSGSMPTESDSDDTQDTNSQDSDSQTSATSDNSSDCDIALELPAENAEFFMNMGTATTGPTMPVVTLKAKAAPCPNESHIQFRFIVGNNNRALEYENAPDGYTHPDPIDSGWLDEGIQTWDVDWGGEIFGGHVTHVKIMVRRTDGTDLCSKKIKRTFWALGGSIYECNNEPRLFKYLETIPNISSVHITMLKAIARVETLTTHFAPRTTGPYSSTFHKRYPIHSADNGYGLFQLTNPVPNRSQIWNWKANADGAYALLQTKEDDARNYLGAHPPYTAQQLKMETYSRYNGGAYHKYVNGQWVRDPDVVCGCDNNNPRKGKLISNPQSECRVRGVCYADYVVTQEYNCP